MKKRIGFSFITILVGLMLPILVVAEEPDDTFAGDPDQAVPIDGGLSLLIAAGVGYGIKKVRDERKRAGLNNEK